MKKIIVLSILSIVSLGLWHCGPPQSAEEVSPYAACYPYDLQTAVNDGSITVMWRSQYNRNISGYNIYISDDPVAANYPGTDLPSLIKPFNHTVYAGDTDPSDSVEHFEAAGLENGKPYYVSVRIVFPDRSVSKPTKEKRVICGPQGEIELSIRYAGEHDGFSFESNTYIPAGDVDNDLYFFSKDGHDYLASPSHLDAFLSYSKLKSVGEGGDLDQVTERLPKISSRPVDDRIEVKVNQWVWIVTGEGNNALVKVLDISGSGKERRIKLFYAFTPSRELPVF
ncbi:MAG TPA: hypothetical protein PLF13_12620 [candidate division Zixibacteria bacterium]|nr:hypothetical protein [candidate division Zixibacteria bacterium]